MVACITGLDLTALLKQTGVFAPQAQAGHAQFYFEVRVSTLKSPLMID
jgi:hypothetical protein